MFRELQERWKKSSGTAEEKKREKNHKMGKEKPQTQISEGY